MDPGSPLLLIESSLSRVVSPFLPLERENWSPTVRQVTLLAFVPTGLVYPFLAVVPQSRTSLVDSGPSGPLRALPAMLPCDPSNLVVSGSFVHPLVSGQDWSSVRVSDRDPQSSAPGTSLTL